MSLGIVAVCFYLGLLGLGICFSIITPKSPKRRNIRIATAISSIPFWLVLTLFIIARIVFGGEPPNLAELQRDFPSKRADLETILRMSDQDLNFSRIAPDFLITETKDPLQSESFMKDDPKASLPKVRWDEYRKIYKKNGIQLGIQRDKQHDAFIMVDSIGLLNRGHVTGYVHCAVDPSVNADRYYPCILHQDRGEQKYDPGKSVEGYSFQRLDGNWFAYDDGPS
jgi:hypothetical protein